MQTVVLHNTLNLTKLVTVLIKLSESKTKHEGQMLVYLRQNHNVKVDSSVLAYFKSANLLKTRPWVQWTGGPATPLNLKELTLRIFEHRVRTQSTYRKLYNDCTPVFSEMDRVKGPGGSYFKSAYEEIEYIKDLEKKTKASSQQEIQFPEDPNSQQKTDIIVNLYDTHFTVMNAQGDLKVMTTYIGSIDYNDLRNKSEKA